MILTFIGSPFQNITPLFKNPYYFLSIIMPSFRYECTSSPLLSVLLSGISYHNAQYFKFFIFSHFNSRFLSNFFFSFLLFGNNKDNYLKVVSCTIYRDYVSTLICSA